MAVQSINVPNCPFQTYLESLAPNFNKQADTAPSDSTKEKIHQVEEELSTSEMENLSNRMIQKLRLLISVYGVDLLIQTPTKKQTPFQLIAEKFPTTVLQNVISILEKKGHKDTKLIFPLGYRHTACTFKCIKGNTATHYAALAGHVDNVVILTNIYPSTLTRKNFSKQTPIDLAPDPERLNQALESIRFPMVRSITLDTKYLNPLYNPKTVHTERKREFCKYTDLTYYPDKTESPEENNVCAPHDSGTLIKKALPPYSSGPIKKALPLKISGPIREKLQQALLLLSKQDMPIKARSSESLVTKQAKEDGLEASL